MRFKISLKFAIVIKPLKYKLFTHCIWTLLTSRNDLHGIVTFRQRHTLSPTCPFYKQAMQNNIEASLVYGFDVRICNKSHDIILSYRKCSSKLHLSWHITVIRTISDIWLTFIANNNHKPLWRLNPRAQMRNLPESFRTITKKDMQNAPPERRTAEDLEWKCKLE